MQCKSIDGFYVMETVLFNMFNFIIYHFLNPTKKFRPATTIFKVKEQDENKRRFKGRLSRK